MDEVTECEWWGIRSESSTGTDEEVPPLVVIVLRTRGDRGRDERRDSRVFFPSGT